MAKLDTSDLRSDIAAAVGMMKATPRGKELRSLETQLGDGEQVRRLASGFYHSGRGLLVLTDRRLLFVREGLLGKTSEDFPFSRVATVGLKTHRFGNSEVIIAASGNAEKITSVDKEDGEVLVNAARDLIGAPGAPSMSSGPSDIPTQLRQLADLRDAGVISSDDFETKKAELLARL